MDKKPPIKFELNILGDDGFRMTIPVSPKDAAEFLDQSKGSYNGILSLWVTSGIDFKTEQERNEFYKINPVPNNEDK